MLASVSPSNIDPAPTAAIPAPAATPPVATVKPIPAAIAPNPAIRANTFGAVDSLMAPSIAVLKESDCLCIDSLCICNVTCSGSDARFSPFGPSKLTSFPLTSAGIS